MYRHVLVALLLVAALPPDSAQAQLEELLLDPRPGDRTGLEIQADSDFLAISAPNPFNAARGRVLVLGARAGAGEFETILTLRPPAGSPVEAFGRSLAFQGTTVAIGDPSVGTRLADAGLVHVVTLSEDRARVRSWTTLASPEPRIAELFGDSLSLQGNRLLVGASGSSASGVRAGAAYLYERRGDDWNLVQTFLPPEPIFEGLFGGRLLLDGDRLLIGAPGAEQGAVHVYERGPDGFLLVESLTPGVGEMDFGRSLARIDGQLLIGGRGFVARYELSDGTWLRQSELRPRRPSDSFGGQVAATDDWIAVSDQFDPSAGPHGGSVRFFRRGDPQSTGVRQLGAPASYERIGFGRGLSASEDTIFIGTPLVGGGSGGVLSLAQSAIDAFPQEEFDFLLEAAVKALAVESDGRLWIGTPTGIIRYDGYQSSRFMHDPDDPASLSQSHVIALLLDRQERLWVGTEDGLNRFDRSSETFVRYPLGPSGEYPRESVVALLEAEDGTLWVGTNGRLFHYVEDRDEFAEYAPFSGEPARLDETYISGLQEDSGGRLWVLAKNLWENRASLYRVDVGADTIDRFPLAPDWGQVGPFLIDDSDAFWIKAPAPARIPDTPGAPVEPAETPAGSTHWGMSQGSGGRVWIGTETGYWVGPAGGTLTPGFVLPRVQDRAPAETIAAFAVDRNDSVLIGHVTGVFEVVNGAPASAAGEPVITRVEVLHGDGITLRQPDPERGIVIAPRDYSVSVEYAVVRPAHAGLLRYRHRLLPVEDQWIPGDRRFARYTDLAPGQYTFQVEVTELDNGQPGRVMLRNVPIEVLPRWWETVWFRLAILVVAITTVAAAISYRQRQRTRLREFRIALANDLHDDLSTSLSGVALASRVLAGDTDEDDPQRSRLGQIADSAEAMLSDLRDIVWLVDPQRDTAQDVVQKMRSVASTVLAGIDFDFRADDEPLARIDMLRRRQLLLIYKEALHNVARHADASSVHIELGREQGDLVMRIADDGRGFDPGDSSLGDGHGLPSMRERASGLGAALEIDSTPGGGTTVVVRLHAN